MPAAGEEVAGRRWPCADWWARWVPGPTRPRLPVALAARAGAVGARAEGCGSLSGSGGFTDEPAGGPYPNGVASRTSPREAAALSGKVTVFSERFEFSFENDAVRGPLVWVCFIFITFFFFFLNLTHHSLCFSQCINFVVSCYLFMALM